MDGMLPVEPEYSLQGFQLYSDFGFSWNAPVSLIGTYWVNSTGRCDESTPFIYPVAGHAEFVLLADGSMLHI